MTPRPFYRWKSFWLGVLAVCSLTWAWRDSIRFESSGNGHGFMACNASGAIMFGYDSQGSVSPGLIWARYEMGKKFNGLTVAAFVPPLLLRGGGEVSDAFWTGGEEILTVFHEIVKASFRVRPREDWLVFIPHWMVLLSFVVPWSTFLIWRRWKMSRLGDTPDQ
jgi:hypothetical protein